jgi:hypothetical protein
VVPSRHCKPTDLANSSDGANEGLWADEEEVLSQAESEAMEAPQHIVAASGRSTCDEARALPHSPNIHPSHRSEKDRLPLKRGRLGQETAHHTHPARPVAFGRLLPGTALSLAQR